MNAIGNWFNHAFASPLSGTVGIIATAVVAILLIKGMISAYKNGIKAALAPWATALAVGIVGFFGVRLINGLSKKGGNEISGAM